MAFFPVLGLKGESDHLEAPGSPNCSTMALHTGDQTGCPHAWAGFPTGHVHGGRDDCQPLVVCNTCVPLGDGRLF